jgi:hypothetical protein
MTHRIKITAVEKNPPDMERVVAALLAFVLKRRAEEAAAKAKREECE